MGCTILTAMLDVNYVYIMDGNCVLNIRLLWLRELSIPREAIVPDKILSQRKRLFPRQLAYGSVVHILGVLTCFFQFPSLYLSSSRWLLLFLLLYILTHWVLGLVLIAWDSPSHSTLLSDPFFTSLDSSCGEWVVLDCSNTRCVCLFDDM